MKKLIIAAIACTAIHHVSAQAHTKVSAETTISGQTVEKRTPVKLEELPDAVITSLKGDAYVGWKPSAAFWVEEEVAAYYEIELARGDDRITVKMDKSGQLLK